MTTRIRLMGSPSVEHEGETIHPRGRKAWALLAYLALVPSPPSRERLVSLLFAEADDPYATLRWNLAELRRTLGPGAQLDGDPVLLRLLRGATIDVSANGPAQGTELGSGDLLEGLDFPACPAFDVWLLSERQQLRNLAQSAACGAALQALASGRYNDAVRAATRAVQLDPLQADHQALLVRALAAGGDLTAARAQSRRCAELFRSELGIDPPSAVLEPAADPPRRTGRLTSPAVARSYLDAGRGALAAGAVDRALAQLRQAVSVAEAVGDPGLRAQAQVALGGALVHAAGARDTACSEILHRGLLDAEDVGDADVATSAARELGFISVQKGNYVQAGRHLRRARRNAVGERQHATVLGVRGMALSDTAHYEQALRSLSRSCEHAEDAGDRRQVAWSRSMIGRVRLLRGEFEHAAEILDDCVAQVRAERWTAFLPWPLALCGDSLLQCGDLRAADDLLQQAYVIATELDDHCWIAVSTPGLARLALAREDRDSALEWIERGLRPEPWYQWARGYLLDAACAIPGPVRERRRHVDELLRLASSTGMRELLVRARLHAAGLGDAHALEAAAWEATDIENPLLSQLIQKVSTHVDRTPAGTRPRAAIAARPRLRRAGA